MLEVPPLTRCAAVYLSLADEPIVLIADMFEENGEIDKADPVSSIMYSIEIMAPLHKTMSYMSKAAMMAVFFCLAVYNPATTFGSDQTSEHLNLDDNGTALQGYDPVSYHHGRPEKGKTELSWEYGGAVYFFADTDNLQSFKTEPERYLPAFGGWCAWAMLDGEKVKIDPKTYKVIDSRTYLFYNFFFVNTLSKWNDLAEQQTDRALVEKAQLAWEKLESR